MSIEQKIQEIQRLTEDLNNDPALEEKQRKALLQTLQQAANKTQTAAEFLWKMQMSPHEYAALRVALDLDLAGQVAKNGSATAKELANATKADKVLIVRIMRILTALGVFSETSPETYGSGKVSSYLDKDQNLGDGMKFMFDTGARGTSRLPEYLESINYQNPSGNPGIWELAFGPGSNLFSWLGANPKSLQHFQNLMVVQRAKRVDWIDIYPVKERLLRGFDSSSSDVLMIDIGGGRGSELEAFKKKFPDAPGRLILQERPEVIDSCPHLDELGIERQSHDFFTAEPVKGARAYYMRSIMHDWPDDKCLEILKNIKAVMKKGYSKILINDWVLPDAGAALYPSALDLHMMTLFSAMERSRTQFQALIDKAGLKMVDVWSVPDNEGCIEVVLPDE